MTTRERERRIKQIKRERKVQRIQGLLLCLAFFFCVALASMIEQNYSLRGTVLNYENKIVTVEDSMGKKWKVDCNKTFETGEEVKVYFNDNNTYNDRSDDRVLTIKKIKKT